MFFAARLAWQSGLTALLCAALYAVTPAAFVRTAAALANQEKLESALSMLGAMLERDPEAGVTDLDIPQAGLWDSMGWMEVYRNPRRAEQIFRKGLTLDPGHERMYIGLGDALIQQKRYDQALGIVQDTTGRFSESAEAWEALGKVLTVLGRHDESMDAVRKSLEINPGNDKLKRIPAKLKARRDELGRAAAETK
jgi:tetratricopeptide (TPR) repeat protein